MNQTEHEGGGDRGGFFVMLVTALPFIIGLASGIAFLVIYWRGAGTGGLGASLALALAGLGVGLVIWTHHLMPHREASGPREEISSDPRDRQAFLDDFAAGEGNIPRRRMLGWLTMAVLGTLTAGAISLVRSLGKPPLPALKRPIWSKGMRLLTINGKPVAAAALDVRTAVVVFPEGQIGTMAAQTMLIRVEEKELQLPPNKLGWAPKGILAYSRVCTHAGCPVALYEADKHLLLCPCHQSTFDVLRGAVPTSGPAARPLAQLPLAIDEEGYLRANGDFDETPGPGFWKILT